MKEQELNSRLKAAETMLFILKELSAIQSEMAKMRDDINENRKVAIGNVDQRNKRYQQVLDRLDAHSKYIKALLNKSDIIIVEA